MNIPLFPCVPENLVSRDGTAEPVSRDQILRHARGQGNIIFPVQLTTSRIGNLTRLIHTLLYVMTIHTYIHTVDPKLSASGNLFECHEEVLYLQPLIPPKRFDIFSPITGGCSEDLGVL